MSLFLREANPDPTINGQKQNASAHLIEGLRLV